MIRWLLRLFGLREPSCECKQRDVEQRTERLVRELRDLNGWLDGKTHR